MNRAHQKLTAWQNTQKPLIGLWVKPELIKMPLPIQRFDDPFLPFGRAIFQATQDLISVYILDLASYFALGAPGIIALERTIAMIAVSESAVLLHGPFWGTDFLPALSDHALNVDAATLVRSEDRAFYDSIMIESVMYQPQAEIASTPTLSKTHLWLQVGEGLAHIETYGAELTETARGEDFAEVIRATLLKLRV